MPTQIRDGRPDGAVESAGSVSLMAISWTKGFKAIEVLALTALVLVALTAPTAFAQNSFDGTWKIDVGTLPKPTGPLVWVLQNGVYECKSCRPAIRVRADGQDQITPGQSYDTISVAVIDDRTVREIEKKNGRIVSDETFVVSNDGETVTDQFAGWKASWRRLTKGPPGSHALSGSWQPLKMDSTSDKDLLITYKIEGNTITMSRPTGQSYRAPLDGTDAPFRGDPFVIAVSVKRIDASTIEETYKLDRKAASLARVSVSADGKSMTITVKDLAAGTTTHFTASKQ
jgi:hypothetical protein